jgi:putative ABC transport system substrate-binding protein
VKRREFLTLVGSAAVAWPLLAHAQQPKRRIGGIMSTAADDREGQARHAAFVEGLGQLGQTEGRNVQIDTRWPVDDVTRGRSAEELVALAPDVIFASGSANVTTLQRITRSVPIVFANVIDPVGAGLVASMSRPGGNTTGFSSFDYSLSGKWLELLKEIAPNLTRVAVLRDPALAAGIGQFAAIQATMPPSFGVELTTIDGARPRRGRARRHRVRA